MPRATPTYLVSKRRPWGHRRFDNGLCRRWVSHFGGHDFGQVRRMFLNIAWVRRPEHTASLTGWKDAW